MGRREPLTPQERSTRARLAALTLHSQVDGKEHTAKARKAALDRFEQQVDPDGVLPIAERRRRADLAKRAYFTRLAIKSAEARKARRRG